MLEGGQMEKKSRTVKPMLLRTSAAAVVSDKIKRPSELAVPPIWRRGAGADARLVIVSNRVQVPGSSRSYIGGLAVALGDAIRPGDLWFGWSGKIAAQTSLRPRTSTAKKIEYATIDLSEQDYRQFYVGYANSTLWPLFHFRPAYLQFERSAFEGYVSVNRSFARALKPLIKRGDLIWVHDYHFIPLAIELRVLGVTNRIGFFLHVPFVPASLFETVPNAKRLLTALCEYDVVGFQTERNTGDFRDCLRRMLGLDVVPNRPVALNGRSVLPLACPIGIDAPRFASDAKRAAHGRETGRLLTSLVGRALIIGVDRLDYTKGLPNKFEGFARLLERFPEHRQKVSYLQIAPISRGDVDEYQRWKIELDRKVGEINGRFAEFDWVPLRYITRGMARRTIAGFYRVARVGLVTPLRDGMNLVAKEFVAAQPPANPGVLVLSAFAGAAEELSEAIIINPHDADAIADALHQALTMSLAERRKRHKALWKRVHHTSARAYCERFLSVLRTANDVGIGG
jgi:trehalose 6-phosphate synthase